jgi:hypothetical protein
VHELHTDLCLYHLYIKQLALRYYNCVYWADRGSDPSARISCVSDTPPPVGNVQKLAIFGVQSVRDCYTPLQIHVTHSGLMM